MPNALLDDRAVLRLSGSNVRQFLQGLVTNDVEGLAPGQARFAALLTPQGKILCDFFVLWHKNDVSDELLLDVPSARIEDLAARLRAYRLRAAIGVEPASSLAVTAIWGEDTTVPHAGIVFRDPRHAEAGLRALAEPTAAAPDASKEAYEAHRIGLALPAGGLDFAYGEAYPHETGMDRLNGVDFQKGCYVGQEVVSRMRHRGSARTRIVQVESDSALPAPFTPVRAGDLPVGHMGSSAGRLGLALLRMDRVHDAMNSATVLIAGASELRVLASGSKGQ